MTRRPFHSLTGRTVVLQADDVDTDQIIPARFLKGTSRFGAELDSLADFVNFGVAPAILLYVWSLNSLRTLGWVICLVLAICCALRLARFNVALDDPNKPAWANRFFTGAPAPAGAGLALTAPPRMIPIGAPMAMGWHVCALPASR